MQKTLDDFTFIQVGCRTDFQCCLGVGLCQVELRQEDAYRLGVGHQVACLLEDHRVMGHLGAFPEVAYRLAFLDVASS